jgi:hypothetical protein
MPANDHVIISPSFLDDSWFLPSTCTLISKDQYSCSFSTTIAESGIVLSIPDSWRNRSIILSFNLSSNACIRIQDPTTWETLCEITPADSPFTILLPDVSVYASLNLAIIAPTETYTTISIDSFNITTSDITRSMHLGDNKVQYLYIGDFDIDRIYLGDALVYESLKPVKLKWYLLKL